MKCVVSGEPYANTPAGLKTHKEHMAAQWNAQEPRLVDLLAVVFGETIAPAIDLGEISAGIV